MVGWNPRAGRSRVAIAAVVCLSPRQAAHRLASRACSSGFSITGYDRLAPVLTSYHHDEDSWPSAILPYAICHRSGFHAV